MKTILRLLTVSLAIAAGGIAATATTASATTCVDGWVSTSTGSGTCSWHGGIGSTGSGIGYWPIGAPIPDVHVAMKAAYPYRPLPDGGWIDAGKWINTSRPVTATSCNKWVGNTCMDRTSYATAWGSDPTTGWWVKIKLREQTVCKTMKLTSQWLCLEYAILPLDDALLTPYGYKHAADSSIVRS
jgi:hypothetical protein